MRLSMVSNLIAHAGFKHQGTAILQFSVQLAFKTREDMPLRTPVISPVAGRVLNQADPDVAEVTGLPVSHVRFAFVLVRLTVAQSVIPNGMSTRCIMLAPKAYSLSFIGLTTRARGVAPSGY